MREENQKKKTGKELVNVSGKVVKVRAQNFFVGGTGKK